MAPKEGHQLTSKFIISSVTYFGNSKNLKVPACDNWACIVTGKCTHTHTHTTYTHTRTHTPCTHTIETCAEKGSSRRRGTPTRGTPTKRLNRAQRLQELIEECKTARKRKRNRLSPSPAKKGNKKSKKGTKEKGNKNAQSNKGNKGNKDKQKSTTTPPHSPKNLGPKPPLHSRHVVIVQFPPFLSLLFSPSLPALPHTAYTIHPTV